jgi:LuxR family maltose regulon positive regulatory protein
VRAVELCQRALVGLPADYLRLRGEALLYKGLASAHLGDFATGTACFHESQRLSLSAGDLHNALFSLCTAAGLDRVRGHLSEAIRLYDQGIALAQQHGVEAMPVMGLLHADYAEVLYERNQLDAAAEQAQAAVSNARHGGSLRFLALGYMNQARLLAVCGTAERANTLFRQADDLITRHQMSSYYAVLLTGIYVPFLLHQRQLAAAVAWVQRHHLRVDDQLSYELELAHLTLARVLLAQGACEQALGLLTRLLVAAEAGERNAHLVLILAVQALGYAAAGDPARALEALRKALALAEPDDYVRTFVDEGPPMAALLREARAHGIFPAYCDRLLTAFPAP